MKNKKLDIHGRDKDVFDTNILIDYFRGVEESAEFLDATDQEKRAISAITLLELCEGERKRGKSGRERIINFLEEYRITVLPVTTDHYRMAGDLTHKYQQKGLDLTDAIIASSCLCTGCTFITRNLRHFEFIDDLIVREPPYGEFNRRGYYD
jgi:predicted nucleic acid-binding protein